MTLDNSITATTQPVFWTQMLFYLQYLGICIHDTAVFMHTERYNAWHTPTLHPSLQVVHFILFLIILGYLVTVFCGFRGACIPAKQCPIESGSNHLVVVDLLVLSHVRLYNLSMSCTDVFHYKLNNNFNIYLVIAPQIHRKNELAFHTDRISLEKPYWI